MKQQLKKVAQSIPGLRPAWRAARRLICGPPLAQLYDQQTIEVIRRVVKPGSVAVDVGANVGDILQELVACSSARHHAIEAIPDLADRLTSRFPSVQVHSCAVSDKNGEVEFNYLSRFPAYSGLKQRDYKFDEDPGLRKIRVPMRQLDDLIPGDVQVALIKLDIEGGEYHALKGGTQLLKRCHPILVMEFSDVYAAPFGATPDMLFDLLTECGYTISLMRRWLHDQPGFDRPAWLAAIRKEYYFIAYPK